MGEPILLKVWIIWSPLLYFNFKTFKDLSSSSFFIWILEVLRTQIFRHSLDFNTFCMIRSTFLRVLKFLQIKEREPNFSEELILQEVRIIWSAFLHFKFKSFMSPESWSFIRFQEILHDSGIRFEEFWNLYKWKRKDLISRKNQLCRKSELPVPPFCISILQVLKAKILRHSLDLIEFPLIQEYLSQTFKISKS